MSKGINGNSFWERLCKLKEEGLYRRMRLVEGESSRIITIDGKRVIQFASNNYLDLASSPKLKRLAQEAIERYGCSGGSSRLIVGNLSLYERLEERLAEFKKTEAALVFNCGYMANIGIISAIMGKDDLILSDELNHATFIDGCRLRLAKVKIFPHRDMEVLEKSLKEAKGFSQKLIVTDGVFSTEGDIAPLPEIVELAQRYGALVMVDEAHATGVLGKNGEGVVEHFGLEGKVSIIMGTFGKALGSFGAYVAGSRGLREFLINKSRSLIFTTALPPAVLATILASLELITKEPERRENLWKNVNFFKGGLEKLGFDTMHSETHIIPILIGDPSSAVKASEMLLEKGVFIPALRPPTVPQGLSRLRLSIMSSHTKEDLDCALMALAEVGRELGIRNLGI